MIQFFVPSTPVAQGRPRISARGGFARAYDPAKSRDYKSWVRTCAIEAMTLTGAERYQRDIPLTMRLEVFILRPKSKPKCYELPTTKPDNTNYAKGIEDALNSICYDDDSQITTSIIKKRYASDPGVLVIIHEDKL